MGSKQGRESRAEEGETEPITGLHCSLLPDMDVTSLRMLRVKELFLLKLPLLGILLQHREQ